MRFSIHTLGTRGDVQPYLALARGLRVRGHEVLLVAPAQFADAVETQGVGFAPLPNEFLALLESPETKKIISGSGAGFAAGFRLLKNYRHLMRGLLDAEWEAARAFNPDAILHHPKALGAPHIAAKLGVPLFLASPLPGFTPTAAFPTPLLPFGSLGPLNRLSHWLMINAGTLYGYSPMVIPKPSDWGRDIAVTGYWFLDMPDWHPDPELAAFLKAGDAPVYVGFGSMPAIDPERLTDIVIDGLRQAGKRGLIATAGGALGKACASQDIHVIAGAPHDRLFAFVHSTLHHGGAGTTGAAIRAGKPTAICPFIGDQTFWARRVASLGVGPSPINKRGMTADKLADAFRAMDDEAMRVRASALGKEIRKEDGVADAISFVEERLAESPIGKGEVLR